MNFDRLRFVAERAEVGEEREALFAVTIPEERGSFKRFCEVISTLPGGAGAALDAFEHIGLSHIPVGTGNTERLMLAIELLEPETAVLTPSYAAHLLEWAAERGKDMRGSSVRRVLVAGEPGGGEPAFRAKLEKGWDAKVTEAMGIGDIGASLWGECEEQDGMHLGARGFVHAELIDPENCDALAITDGAKGELVLSHLEHRAAPLVRFRTRDHVEFRTSPCPCGWTSPRVRCIGRTDDMLIVRGVNVFPSAVREVVNGFAPRVSGHILVRPRDPGVKQVAAASGSRSSSPRTRLRMTSWRRRSASGCGACRRAGARRARPVGKPAAERVQVEARRALSSDRHASRNVLL